MTEVKDYDSYLRLSRVFNSTLGTDGPGRAVSSSQNAKLLLKNEKVVEAVYQSIVTFTTDKVLDALMPKFRNEGLALINSTLEKAIEQFAKEFPGHSIKLDVKTDTCKDHVEFIHYNVHNPVRRAMYRTTCLIEITEKIDGSAS